MLSQLVSPYFTEEKSTPDYLSGSDSPLYQVYATTPARVYHAHLGAKQPDWIYSRMKGTLVFGRDRDTRPGGAGADHRPNNNAEEEYWFRLIDEVSGKPVWVFKVPPGLNYQLDRPFFHVFQGRSRRFGFLFDDDDEALEFAKKVISQICPGQASKSRGRRSKSTTSIPPIQRSMISAPKLDSFVHVAHIGVNQEGVLEASQGLDSAWKGILANLQGGVHEKGGSEHQGFVEGFWSSVETVRRNSDEGKSVSSSSSFDGA
ncbi:hypothetical protein BD779DRAFT_1610000 [Infundibulicybe gibba]|nr:hypothetical protein BD779DRAFT_1610000 [Infundibulicybe gibba]